MLINYSGGSKQYFILELFCLWSCGQFSFARNIWSFRVGKTSRVYWL